MTHLTIKCLTPNDFEITLTEEITPDQAEEYLLTWDKWLKSNGFKPLPIPKSGGGNWNKGGNAVPRPKNWVDVDPDKPILYVNLAWHGENKEQNDTYKIEWANKLEAATGVRYTLDTSKVDEKGKKLYLWVFPLAKGRELLAALPDSEFERRPTLQARLEAAKDK